MSLKNKAKAIAKNIEGKVQEAAGALTDNHEDRARGKAKQAEAQVRHRTEEIKDAAKKMLE